MIDPCPICGKNRVLVGIAHNCGPPVTAPTKLAKRKAKKPDAKKAKKPKSKTEKR